MKTAFLFSGQLRTIPKELFRKSLLNLTSGLDYDIYAYLWDETGKSLNHSKNILKVNKEENARVILTEIMDGFNLKKIISEPYTEFNKKLEKQYKELINSNKYHLGTINSIPQIYMFSKCFDLISENLEQYDLIFKCRFDTLFLHPLNLYDLDNIKKESAIYSINFGRAYHPNRIYDIFFGGSKKSMILLRNIWKNLPNYINDSFDNNLDKRDACRLFYLAAIKQNIKCRSLNTRICDVFRNFDNNYYEKYILSMHLISIRKIKSSFKSIPFFMKWFKFRKMSGFLVIYSILISFLILPFSYLKRIKNLIK